MKRLPYCLWLPWAVVSALGGCGATSPLPRGTHEAAADRMPGWTQSGKLEDCEMQDVCVVGTASQRPSREEAERAARENAVLQLSQLAFPMDVVNTYTSDRINDAVAITDTLRTRLSGRVSGGLSVKDQFWIAQRTFDGQRGGNAYSAWVIMAISRRSLEDLKQSEEERSRVVADAAAIEVATLPPVDASNFSYSIGVLDRIDESLAGLVATPERDVALAAVRERLTTIAGAFRVDFVSRTSATSVLKATHAGSPIPLTAVRYRAGKTETDVVTDADGNLQVVDAVVSPLDGSVVEVWPGSVESLSRTVTCPARVTCGTFRVESELGGPGISSGLVSGALSPLESVVRSRLPDCVASESTLTLRVEGTVAGPRVIEGTSTRVLGGTVAMVVVVHRSDGVAEIIGRTSRLVKGAAGTDPGIVRALMMDITAAGREALTSALAIPELSIRQ